MKPHQYITDILKENGGSMRRLDLMHEYCQRHNKGVNECYSALSAAKQDNAVIEKTNGPIYMVHLYHQA